MKYLVLITCSLMCFNYYSVNASLSNSNNNALVQNDFYDVVNQALRRPRGWPPLAYAVKLRRHDVVKFLLDHGEKANECTPNLPLWYEGSSSSHPSNIGNLYQGYSPLELAVFYEDVEMVKVLTTYHKTNKSTPEISHVRYTDLMYVPKDIWEQYNGNKIETGNQNRITTTPFLEALKTGNEALIIAVMQSYENIWPFLSLRAWFVQKKSPDLIKAWLEHQSSLVNIMMESDLDYLSDLFLQSSLNELLATQDYENAELLLTHGWIIKENEVLDLVREGNVEGVKFLLAGSRWYDNFDIYDLLINHDFFDINFLSLDAIPALIKNDQANMLDQAIENLTYIPEEEDQVQAIKNGANEVVKLLISRGWFWKGALRQAVEQKHVHIVKTLLDSSLFLDEIDMAKTVAYNNRSFEILELLEKY